MAYLNVNERIIETKIVYYGAGLSGKTTNLEMVKKLSTEGRAGEMMTLDTDGDRTLFFDWLPYNIGKFNGCDVKMQLYTVPGQAKYAETRRRVLASADGVVLVLDSQSGALERNKQTLSDLRDHMSSNKLGWGAVPVVVQLNKRDLPTAMDPSELMTAMGLLGLPFVPAVAAKGEGVFETLREAAKLVLHQVRDAARARSPELKSGAESELDGKTLYAQLTGGAPIPAGRKGTNGAATALATAAPAPSGPGANGPGANGAAPSREHAANGAVSPVRLDDVAGSPGQLYELVTAHRALLRRLDGIEQSVQQVVASHVAEMERRVLGHLTGASAREHAVRDDLKAVQSRLEELMVGGFGAQVAKSDLEPLQKTLEGSAAAQASLLGEAARSLSEKLDEAAKQDTVLQAALSQIKSEVMQSLGILGKKIDADTTKLDLTLAKRVEAETAKLDVAVARRLEAEAQKAETARQEVGRRIEAAVASAVETLTAMTATRDKQLEGKIETRAATTESHVRVAVEGVAERVREAEGKVQQVLDRLRELADEARQTKKPWWR